VELEKFGKDGKLGIGVTEKWNSGNSGWMGNSGQGREGSGSREIREGWETRDRIYREKELGKLGKDGKLGTG
jgi:hypothetical protein